jgi:hypothetical protein
MRLTHFKTNEDTFVLNNNHMIKKGNYSLHLKNARLFQMQFYSIKLKRKIRINNFTPIMHNL